MENTFRLSEESKDTKLMAKVSHDTMHAVEVKAQPVSVNAPIEQLNAARDRVEAKLSEAYAVAALEKVPELLIAKNAMVEKQ